MSRPGWPVRRSTGVDSSTASASVERISSRPDMPGWPTRGSEPTEPPRSLVASTAPGSRPPRFLGGPPRPGRGPGGAEPRPRRIGGSDDSKLDRVALAEQRGLGVEHPQQASADVAESHQDETAADGGARRNHLAKEP